MGVPSVRVWLAGRVAVEAGGTLAGPEAFPGQQGRVAFAYLVLERDRPVTREELAETLWPEALPAAWESALNAIASKLRGVLARPGGAALVGARGSYELRLPGDAWVDVEVAADAIHDAETAMRAGDPARAYGPSAVAHHVARRPFLPGERGAWVERRRDALRDVLLRALEVRAELYLWNREPVLALQSAKALLALEPFREAGHRLLIRSHAALGNTAEALWAYEQCRRLIARELGVDPSPETKATYERVLQTV